MHGFTLQGPNRFDDRVIPTGSAEPEQLLPRPYSRYLVTTWYYSHPRLTTPSAPSVTSSCRTNLTYTPGATYSTRDLQSIVSTATKYLRHHGFWHEGPVQRARPNSSATVVSDTGGPDRDQFKRGCARSVGDGSLMSGSDQ
jgi:hypothetical protein